MNLPHDTITINSELGVQISPFHETVRKVEDDEETKTPETNLDLHSQIISSPSNEGLNLFKNYPGGLNINEEETEEDNNLEDSDSYDGDGGFFGGIIKKIKRSFHRLNSHDWFNLYNGFLVVYVLVNLIVFLFWILGKVRLNLFLIVLLISNLILGVVKIRQKLNQMLFLPTNLAINPERRIQAREFLRREIAERALNNSGIQTAEPRPDLRLDSLTEAQRLNYARLRLHFFNLRLQLFLNNLGLTALTRGGLSANTNDFDSMINQVILLTPPNLILGLQQQIRGLTPAEIENFPTQKYKAKKKSDDSNQQDHADEQCMICLEAFSEDFDIRRLPCFHIFHKECIDKWLERQADCPLCKHSLV